MYKAVATALTPLVVAVLTALGLQFAPEAVQGNLEFIIIVLGAIGSAIAARFPSVRAALKFGKDAK